MIGNFNSPKTIGHCVSYIQGQIEEIEKELQTIKDEDDRYELEELLEDWKFQIHFHQHQKEKLFGGDSE